MNEHRECRCYWVSCLPILYCAVTAGCSGSDPILGVGGNVVLPSAVIDVAPQDGAIAVPVDAALVIEGGDLTLDAQPRNVFW